MSEPNAKASPYDALPTVASFTLTSTDVREGEKIPDVHRAAMAGGKNLSPQLAWSDVPAGTKSFAITMYDPDAPTGSGFWHWAIYNVPADVASLEQGAGTDSAKLPKGAVALSNELRDKAYTGCAPPKGHGRHRYYFVVHALDVEALDLPEHATPAYLGFNMFTHTLGRAILQGWQETT